MHFIQRTREVLGAFDSIDKQLLDLDGVLQAVKVICEAHIGTNGPRHQLSNTWPHLFHVSFRVLIAADRPGENTMSLFWRLASL
ncbi:hypothetical protein D3C85_1764740 [compost metagenome]